MVSALEHYSYCPRQCALIHVEHVFDENLYTLRGRRVHERVHEPDSALEDGTRVERELPTFSDRLGLVGKADVVEFPSGSAPYPVEYKSGARRQSVHDDVQLCAQALCLEEMLGQEVPKGAIYHFASRRRQEVMLDEELRSLTVETVKLVREMLGSEALPPPVADARCPKCSLYDACMPNVLKGASADVKALFDLRR